MDKIYYIFKCEACGEIFEEEVDTNRSLFIKNFDKVARYMLTIHTTHKCSENQRGCARLVGARREEKQ